MSGTHVLIDLMTSETTAGSGWLKDCPAAVRLLHGAAIVCKETVVHEFKEDFGNGGFRAHFFMRNSHITIATFPAERFATIHIYTDRGKNPIQFAEFLLGQLKHSRAAFSVIPSDPKETQPKKLVPAPKRKRVKQS